MSCYEHKEGNEPYSIVENEEDTIEHIYCSKCKEEKIHFVVAVTVTFPLPEGVDYHESNIKGYANDAHVSVCFEIRVVCKLTSVREFHEVIATYT